MTLQKEDYEEPCCLLDMAPPDAESPRQTVPIGRIIEKLEDHLGRDDYAAAERHLAYWRAEAAAGRDRRGLLSLWNETVGLMRKLGRREEALCAAQEALSLMRSLGLSDSLTGATTRINAATALKAFGEAARSLVLFEEAAAVYEAHLPAGDGRLGGLYNNWALSLADTGRFAEARARFLQALAVMRQVPGGELEQAVTQLNLADLAAREKGPEEAESEIFERLEKAAALLDTPSLPHDGYYAFVAEKCAPGFRFHGWFAQAQKLEAEARRIYGKSQDPGR